MVVVPRGVLERAPGFGPLFMITLATFITKRGGDKKLKGRRTGAAPKLVLFTSAVPFGQEAHLRRRVRCRHQGLSFPFLLPGLSHVYLVSLPTAWLEVILAAQLPPYLIVAL